MARLSLMKAILAVFVRANKVASAGGKTAVFGLLKRNGKVFVVVVKDTKPDTLMPIITSKIKPDSIVYTDSYKSYNALDVSDFKHFRINHSKEFAQDHNHIKAQENFWSQAKRVPPILQQH
ncbi:Transposase and inactivated derivatives [Moraxella lacunata]|uniref:Transposase and inactivated derivatives n=1 Tax=Moraxella lacunata TaxID=477 RepID=A0A378TS32_MORLA|nr:Transposase and inactivated derivatives [Moraxella lacunata]